VLVSAATVNGDGLRVTGGTATINNPSGTQTLFTFNGRFGIEVTGLGGVSVVGTPGAPVPSANGTVLTTFNSNEGIFIQQTAGGGAARALSDINGLVSWGNTNRDARFRGGSRVRVRNSVFGAGAEGIRIDTGGGSANAADNNDISGIDLGIGSNYGKNYIQMSNGILGFHLNVGICFVLAGVQPAQNLNATGNFLTTAGNPGTQLDCSTAGGTVFSSTNCNANSRVSFGNATPNSEASLAAVERADRAMLESVLAVDARGFYDQVAADQDARRICGLSPIHALLRVLPAAPGRLLQYRQWPDPEGAVTFCAVGFP